MSLPKRDGVHDRYYLIHKPDTSPEVLAEADICIQDVLNGTARENHSAYPTVVRNHNGTPFLPDQLLERYLTSLPLKGFPNEDAVFLCDAMRRLVGWQEIRYTLEKYIEKQVQERYFEAGEKEDDFTPYPPCTVCPELRPEDVDEGLLRFACYVAVCHTVYGQSFESLTTEHILGLVSQLRPNMVKQLKTGGSGKLPPNIQKRKTKHMTASANDAFATIRITAKDSTEECYDEALDYLCAVLSQEEFPRSYSVEFKGKEKTYLPIPGLPKKGVNQLFACAVQHPDLHPAMERYVRLAMREFEWYQNLADEACAMPGSFAVFALGLEGHADPDCHPYPGGETHGSRLQHVAARHDFTDHRSDQREEDNAPDPGNQPHHGADHSAPEAGAARARPLRAENLREDIDADTDRGEQRENHDRRHRDQLIAARPADQPAAGKNDRQSRNRGDHGSGETHSDKGESPEIQ